MARREAELGITLVVVPGVRRLHDDGPMRMMVGFGVCGVLSGCGTAEPPRVARTQPASSLRFVVPPLVVADSGGGVTVWVRMNRPLRDNEGLLGEDPGVIAEIEISGTTRDIPGLYRDDLHPSCYGQFLYGPIADGAPVDVALVLSASERISATVAAQAWTPGNVDARALQRLGCPSDRGATRRCRASVPARNFDGVETRSATNASCSTARAVMRRVARWANSQRCYETLCVGRHRINRGFRCSVDLVGEAAWQITCVRGDRIVRGYTAE